MSVKDIRPYKGKRKALLETLADPANCEADTTTICKLAKISKESYYKYTKEKNFQDALRELSIAIYVRHLPQSVNSVVKQSKKGNINANRLIHDAIGMTGKGTVQTVNVGVSNEGQTIDTGEIQDDNEALALIAQEREQLDAWEHAIRARMGSDRMGKGDGIHPGTGAGEDEGA